MRLLFALSFIWPLQLSAQVPTLEAQAETTPIPIGFSDSDDAAVWSHPTHPNLSLILGTSKYEDDGQGGLGVYDLDGRELQFFAGSKLNSVDVVQNIVVASNRTENALDVYRINDGRVSFLTRTSLQDAQGQVFEPYGLCLAETADHNIQVYLPTKSGLLYEYTFNQQYEAQLNRTFDLAARINPEQDAFITSIVTKETASEGEMDELEENLSERFVLEGCVVDPLTHKLYIGMENFGIWSLDTDSASATPELIIPVQGSWTDIEQWQQPGLPRVTDDIEGLDIVQHDGRSYLLFSSQGISEFTLYDLSNLAWVGNFKINFGVNDPITLTDGVSVKTGYLGARFPEGVLIVHDDENTEPDGSLLPANYKMVSLTELWKIFPKAGD